MVNETLNEFTLLVSLSPSTFDYAKALPSGADLRFVAADGLTLLSHEIDTWNTSGESLVWVKLPSIAASGTTTSFYLYYGNNAAAPLPLNLARATWKSGTKLVYHFNGQNADGSSGVNSLYEDSTGSNSHAVKRGTVTIVTSRVGNGISTLAGNIDLRGSGPEISHLNNAQTLTAVAWVRTLGPGPSSRHAILCYGSNTSNADNRMCFQIRDDRHRIFSRTDDSTFVEVTADGNSYVTRDVWTLVAYSFNTATGDVKMYTDGQLTFSTTLTLPAAQFPSSPSIGASIGSLADGSFQFEGYLDEVRLYEGILSGEWLKAEYLSQNAPASFAVAGAEHVQPD
ncbi:MAG: DUF2341 domain-containing protein [Silvanigrellales bacterium]|nr:DUF2341 domain-containing protein [Silvanigrellales bacterium]